MSFNGSFHVVIPARLNSTRLPGKLLLKIGAQTVLERVYHQAIKASPTSVTIATDSDEIARHAESFGAAVVMTSSAHTNGSERIAEAVQLLKLDKNAIIINVQGDEPFIPPENIVQLAEVLAHSTAPTATLCWPIESLEQLNNPNVVKVVVNKHHHALYFSRSAIPLHRDVPSSIANTFRHIGIYAYRAQFLLDYVSWPITELEQQEALEMLRILWNGYPIEVQKACQLPPQDINTEADWVLVCNQLATELGL